MGDDFNCSTFGFLFRLRYFEMLSINFEFTQDLKQIAWQQQYNIDIEHVRMLAKDITYLCRVEQILWLGQPWQLISSTLDVNPTIYVPLCIVLKDF